MTTTTDTLLHKGRKRVNLALQGGGSHGAFTWGVLHRLMEDGRIFIDGISGTSAGAMNAVVFTDGFIRGRQPAAIKALNEFWHRVAECALLPTALAKSMTPLPGPWSLPGNMGFEMLDAITRMYSPSQLNPLDINPLRDILNELVDFEGLRAHKEIKLFVGATNVRTCKLKVFRTPDITVECLLASACLPTLFRAVEINGESYWDGGFLANPAISPLIHECVCKDVIIVQINPMIRPDVPDTARDILDRLNEISFNSCLMREMNGIATVSRLLDEGKTKDHHLSNVKFHMIDSGEYLSEFGSSSKFNADWDFLRQLHDLGMQATDRWLAAHFNAIGNSSTLDMIKTYE